MGQVGAPGVSVRRFASWSALRHVHRQSSLQTALSTRFPARSPPFPSPLFPLFVTLLCENVGSTAVASSSVPPAPPAGCQVQGDRRQPCLQSRPVAIQRCFGSFTAISKSSKGPDWYWVCQVCLARVAGSASLSHGLTFS